MPKIIWYLFLVEFAERASYYGSAQIMTNFVLYPLPQGGDGSGKVPKGSEEPTGALGRGATYALVFASLFRILVYTVPLLGSMLGDSYGRFLIMMIGVYLGTIGHILQVVGSIPAVLQRSDIGQGLAWAGMVTIAIGVGFFKPIIYPMVIYQHPEGDRGRILKNNRRVIEDYNLTVTRMTSVFYVFVNMGAWAGWITSTVAKYYGYWIAFIIPTILYAIIPFVMYPIRKKIRHPPQAVGQRQFWKIVWFSLHRNKFRFWRSPFFDVAKRHHFSDRELLYRPPSWTDEMVDEVAQTFRACDVFFYLPFFHICNSGVGVVGHLTSSTMTKGVVPSEIVFNLNPVAVTIFGIATWWLYPWLKKQKMMPSYIGRMVFGFNLVGFTGFYAFYIQHHVYGTSLCEKFVTLCSKNPVFRKNWLDWKGLPPGTRWQSTDSVWLMSPIYIFGGIAEVIALAAAYQLAYNRASKTRKSIVMGINLFQYAIANACSFAFTPLMKDPNLIWAWLVPGLMAMFMSYVMLAHYTATGFGN